MPILDFITSARNKIVIGGIAGVGLIVTTTAAIFALAARPAFQVTAPSGGNLFSVSNHGAVTVGTGATASGNSGDCLKSGGSSGALMSFGTCGGGNNFVNKAGDTMTGTLTLAPISSSASGLVIKMPASTTANYEEMRNSNNHITQFVDSAGNTAVGSGAGLYLYNTNDTTTNYERLHIGYDISKNILGIRSEKGGAGTLRPINFFVGGGTSAFLVINPSTSSNPIVGIGNFTENTATNVLNVALNASQSATSGTNNDIITGSNYNPSSSSTMVARGLAISPTINYQAGGAGSYEALKVNVTETALPTGQNYLARMSAGAAGTTDAFTVFNNGATTITSLGVTGTGLTIVAAANQTAAIQSWKNNAGSALATVDNSGSIIISNTMTEANGKLQVRGTISGASLQIGGTTAKITNILTNTATIDFGNLATLGCEDNTVTVNGAALSDVVSLGVPNAAIVANGNYFGWVSAANTVTVRFCTFASGDPASGSFRVEVHHLTP